MRRGHGWIRLTGRLALDISHAVATYTVGALELLCHSHQVFKLALFLHLVNDLQVLLIVIVAEVLRGEERLTHRTIDWVSRVAR